MAELYEVHTVNRVLRERDGKEYGLDRGFHNLEEAQDYCKSVTWYCGGKVLTKIIRASDKFEMEK